MWRVRALARSGSLLEAIQPQARETGKDLSGHGLGDRYPVLEDLRRTQLWYWHRGENKNPAGWQDFDLCYILYNANELKAVGTYNHNFDLTKLPCVLVTV